MDTVVIESVQGGVPLATYLASEAEDPTFAGRIALVEDYDPDCGSRGMMRATAGLLGTKTGVPRMSEPNETPRRSTVCWSKKSSQILRELG